MRLEVPNQRSLWIALAVVTAVACGDDDHDHEVDHEMCFGDEDVLAPGLSKQGTDGNFTVEIVSYDPDPLIVGNNDFVIDVTDAANAPVTGATFDVLETWQRVHDHGTPVTAMATELQDGQYEVVDMNVVHRGSWLFRFGPNDGTNSDFVEWNFGVDCPTE